MGGFMVYKTVKIDLFQ